jgi:hypothetical protein
MQKIIAPEILTQPWPFRRHGNRPPTVRERPPGRTIALTLPSSEEAS